MTSGYVSTDGGESWRLFQLGGSPLVFAFDPASPSVIYAGNAALWRSEDRGGRGDSSSRLPSAAPRRHHWSDHGDTVYTTDDPLYPSGRYTRLHAVAVDPTDTNRLLVALEQPADRAAGHDTRERDRGPRVARPRKHVGAARLPRPGPCPRAVDRERTASPAPSRPGGRGRARPRAGALRRPGRRTLRLRQLRPRARSGRTLLYATSPFGPDGTGGLHVSEDGGRSWRPSGRGARRPVVRRHRRARPGARPPRRGRSSTPSPPRRGTASWPTWACAA